MEASVIDCFSKFPNDLAIDLGLIESERQDVNKLLSFRFNQRKENVKEVYGDLASKKFTEENVSFANKRLTELEGKSEEELVNKLEEALDPIQIDKVLRFIIKGKGVMFGKISIVANRLKLSIRQRKMVFDLQDEIVAACMKRLEQGDPNPSDLTSVREISVASNAIFDSWNKEQLTAYAHAIGMVEPESSLIEHFESANATEKEKLARGFKFFRDLNRDAGR